MSNWVRDDKLSMVVLVIYGSWKKTRIWCNMNVDE